MSERKLTKFEEILRGRSRFIPAMVLALQEADKPLTIEEIADMLGTSIATLRAQALPSLFKINAVEAIQDPDSEDRKRRVYRLRQISVVDNRTESEKLRDKRRRSRVPIKEDLL